MPMTSPTSVTRPSWSGLGTAARAWRVAHTGWSIMQLACLAHIGACVAGRRRNALLWASVGLLGLEGAALVAGRGSCPMGTLQARWGDPVPFFELVLPRRAAKAAVPILAGVSLALVAAVACRRPGLVFRA